MYRIRIVLASFIFLLWCFSAYAKTTTVSVKIPDSPTLVKTQMNYANNILTITNRTNHSVALHNAILKFYYRGEIASVEGINQLKLKSQIGTKSFANLPNQPGNLFEIKFGEINQPNLLPGQSIKLKIKTGGNNQPSGFKLFASNLIPVQVKVTVLNPNWTQTIQVCNNTNNNIPLKNVEFDFSFNGSITSIWGQPWTAWTVASNAGNNYVLTGGTPWTPDLLPDPNCQHPLTIQFSSTPTSPAPSGPFTFKAQGGVPVGYGSVDITLPNSPTAGLPNPTITVQGMGTTNQQTVNWGQQWQINNLAPGSYTISASQVDNGQLYYQSAPMNVNVDANVTTPVSISYQSVQTANVAITLSNAPASQEQITFTGRNYVFNKNVNVSDNILLPTDSYTVTSSAPGYSVLISPNPLNVPNNTSLSLTYQKLTATPIFGGYFESWSTKWATDPSATEIANLPGYVNYVYLSFMRPDSSYQKGSMDFTSTGLQFNYASGSVLQQAIAILHQKNPNTKVIVSVGGATYTNWSNFNPQAVANFVSDFGIDGVDIDYEVPSPGCALGTDGLIHCQIDSQYQSIIESMRMLLPRPYIITVAAWSIAAYGQDQWSNAQPQGNYTGMMLPFFRSPAAKDLDMVNVMSYDASNAYDPTQALAAYSHYYPGPISMGVEVPPEAWGGHVYTLSQVNQLAQTILTSAPQHNTPPGMMMWSLQKIPNGTPSADNPSAQMIASAICTDFGLNNCNSPLFQ